MYTPCEGCLSYRKLGRRIAHAIHIDSIWHKLAYLDWLLACLSGYVGDVLTDSELGCKDKAGLSEACGPQQSSLSNEQLLP